MLGGSHSRRTDGRSHVRRLRRRLRGALVALLFVSGCDACQCPPGPPDTEAAEPEPIEIASVEVIPHTVHAASGLKVRLVARLRDQDGHIVPEVAGFVPSWSWVTGLMPPEVVTTTLQPLIGSGHTVTVTVPNVTGDASIPIRATVNGQIGDGTVVVAKTTGDRILVEYDPAKSVVPVVALADGWRTTCVNDFDDDPVAFQQEVDVGNFTEDCSDDADVTGEVAVFSATAQMGFRALSWTNGRDDVDYSSTAGSASPFKRIGQALGSPLEVKLKLWYPFPPGMEDWKAEVLDEVNLASSVFRTNRAGITLPASPETESADLVALYVSAATGMDPWDCSDLKTRLGTVIPASAFGPTKLNVLYVMRLTDDPAAVSQDASYAGYRGYTCPISDSDGGVILIDWQDRDDFTLAHELGHMFGLRNPPLPSEGHTSYIGGFLRSDNLMLTYLSDESWIPRENLSLGQMFRINVDTRSWINVAGAVRGLTQIIDPSGLACQCNPYENKPCPRLSLDIANVSNDSQSVGC